jgi:hypothetical protein
MTAFNAAIEKAVIDPEFASRLSADMAKRTRNRLTPTRALVQAIYATPIAVNSKIAKR